MDIDFSLGPRYFENSFVISDDKLKSDGFLQCSMNGWEFKLTEDDCDELIRKLNLALGRTE